ncbi:MAG: penicillin acylase family protein [Acidimicrobiales bacterium]
MAGARRRARSSSPPWRNRLGRETGRQAWEDLMQTDDPESPTTLQERFDYGTFTGGDVTGSAVIDEGSIISFDPTEPAPGSAPALTNISYPAAGDPPDRQASNWLTVAPDESVDAATLAVMGPQLGYCYPEIVMQIHLSGPGIEAQGAAVPGLAMYLLIGRTEDYAWSLTSANQDVRDVFAEVLCEPDGSTPTRESGSYLHEGGACRSGVRQPARSAAPRSSTRSPFTAPSSAPPCRRANPLR